MTQAQAAVPKPFPPGMPVRPGDVIGGKYAVEDLVAVGGMGVVVRAKHLSLGHKVAIKVLLPAEAESGQAIPRFLREARAAAGLSSDHVVRIHDVDTLESGLPYMVMELLSGKDLRRIVKTEGPLEIQQAVEFVLQASDAIGQAHALGIVHRDLKPSNLFLTERSDGKPLVKVLDFGISKASHDPLLEGTLTTTRAMMGSPMYMSPEQVRDAKGVDARSDIWSLGVILHELLAGRPAFRGDSLPAICASIAADPPASLRAARPDVPAELEALVLRCLDKDPARRFQTVAELKQALLPFAGREPSAWSGPISASSLGARPESRRVAMGSISFDAEVSASGPISRQDLETLPTQRFERSGPQAPSTPTAALLPASDAPMAATGVGARPRRARSLLLALGALVLLGAVALAAVVGLRASKGEAASSATPAAPVVSATFELTLESQPSGADVIEGNRVLGKTPLTLALGRAEVSARPRVFRLDLAGHEPYEHTQGPADEKVVIRPRLEPLPAPSPSPSAPETARESSPRPTRGPASTRKTTPDNSGKPSTDIRLSR